MGSLKLVPQTGAGHRSYEQLASSLRLMEVALGMCVAAPKKSLDALAAGAQMKAAHSEMHGPFPVLDICASTGLSLCCKRSGSRNQAECGQCEARQYIELGSSCTSAVGGCPLNAVKTTAHKSSPVYMQ